MNRRELQALIERAVEYPAARKRLSDIARAYRPNEDYDRLIGIRNRDPARFDAMVTPTIRMSVGYHEVSKTAHDAFAEIDGGKR